MTWTIDERRSLIVPGDKEETENFAISHFVKTAQESIEKRGRFIVALSGGSTPKAIYHALASPPYASQIEWSKVYLFWSDERAVNPSDPMSNYLLAKNAGLMSLVPSSNIFRMRGEEGLEEESVRYEREIRSLLQGDLFDLIMLGMGADGHTASLFPNTKALHEKGSWIAPNFVEAKNSYRLTMTLPCLTHARVTAFYVLGESKQETLSNVLTHNTPLLPASLVGTSQRPALWIADKAASHLFLETFSLPSR